LSRSWQMTVIIGIDETFFLSL